MLKQQFQRILLLALLSLALAACASTPTATSTSTAAPLTPTLSAATYTATSLPTATLPPTVIPTATLTPLPTETQTPTPSPTSIPTYVKLRGEVIIDQAVCHYGPGAPYLYKYGVYKGSNLEIIGRDERGVYIEVQAIRGNNPCWVKAEYMKIKGDLLNVQPISTEDVPLPMSPYYPPLTRYSARRDGNTVTVFWGPLVLRPGDDSEQVPYVLETWTCHNGQILFEPVGSYTTAIKVTDEPGCSTPSHARLTAAEKHGYTRFVEIPWPQPE